MEPTSIPDSWKDRITEEGGWVTDRRLLHTLFALGGAQHGDEIFAVRLDGMDYHITAIIGAGSEAFVREQYGNERVANNVFVILGWRRPRAKQHS